MSKKNNLITTSAIISLMLFNVSNVNAESQMPKVETSIDDSTADTLNRKQLTYEDISEQLQSFLNDKQKQTLRELLVVETEEMVTLEKGILLHESENYDKALKFYEAIVTELNQEDINEVHNESMKEIMELFTRIVKEEITLLNYSEWNADKEEIEEFIKPEEAEEAIEPEEVKEEVIEEIIEPQEIEKDIELEETVQLEKEIKTKEDTPAQASPIQETPKIQTFRMLAQPKEDFITSEKSVHYRATLSRSTDGINTRPWGTAGFQHIRLVNDWVGREVRVTKEAVTPRATWAYIEVLGTGTKGWIDKAGLDIESITSEKTVHYRGTLKRSNDGINTKPWGTEGYETVKVVGDWVGREVKVIKEAVTSRATWAYIEVLGTGTKGWIDKSGLNIESIASEKTVHYWASLKRSSDGINTKPWGTEGYETVKVVGDWVNREVIVTKEAITSRATWGYIEVPGTNIKGWIDTAGLEKIKERKADEVLSEKSVHYRATLSRSTDGINTRPWGTAGFQHIRLVNDWVGREVRVTKEAVTPRATWSYVEVLGTGTKGWVDKAGLDIESITSEKTVHYRGTLKRSNDGINTKPWGTEGYETVKVVGDWVGREVKVIKEAVTPRATWSYVEVVGTEIKGWIDKTGITIESVTSDKPVHYRATLNRSYDGINTKPWGTEGYQTVKVVGDWVGREVNVTKEAITTRATWSYIQVLGTDVSGWIDKSGLNIEAINSEKKCEL